MDIIQKTRELAAMLQQEEVYVALKAAQTAADEDKQLQDAIGEFNLKRLTINNEAQKPDRDDAKLQELNIEMRTLYAQITANEKYAKYNAAREELQTLVQRVTAIISNSAEGEDPQTTDYTPSCGGSCSSCSGCG
ncbi:MAG: YlbF family regulator [Oscillospiraceae bacterium]|jgi:cell fate (sporulation/competence/biofilm development) regulator YlbF (YheA/YmcA/DUF963 family)|nr:YlbF family regulator [Oscillospiraceae bacterium]